MRRAFSMGNPCWLNDASCAFSHTDWKHKIWRKEFPKMRENIQMSSKILTRSFWNAFFMLALQPLWPLRYSTVVMTADIAGGGSCQICYFRFHQLWLNIFREVFIAKPSIHNLILMLYNTADVSLHHPSPTSSTLECEHEKSILCSIQALPEVGIQTKVFYSIHSKGLMDRACFVTV